MTPCPVCFENAEVVEGRCFGCGFKRGYPVSACTDCGYTSCPGYCGLSERDGMVPGEIPGQPAFFGAETPPRSLSPATRGAA